MDEDKVSKKANSVNKLFQSGDVSYCNLEEFGIKLPSHVSNRVPNTCIVIECVTDFAEAVQQLKKQDAIAVSLEGSNIGRSGTLEWLNISSSMCTYLFNISCLGKDAFDNGLKTLLENKRIVKILHDCRRASDCFYHQYNTKPSNVYDTQVADIVANAIKTNVDLITNKANSLNHCLELYLNVPKEYLCENFNAAVTCSSLPLNHDLMHFLVKNVIYLRILKQELDMILRMPFRRCVDVYLNVILRKSDEELKLYRSEPELVPPELVIENMQLFKFTEKLKPPDSSKLEAKDDPVVRYERDCKRYQQKYGYGKFADCKEPEIDLNYGNIDGGWSYSNRGEIVQFLLDRMFTCDSSDRSVISMTPFENLTERDDFSEVSETDICFDINNKISNKNERENLPVPYCNSENSRLPLRRQIYPPSEVPNAMVGRGLLPTDVHTPVVGINLSNDETLFNANRSRNFETNESVSSGSSLSTKSHVDKMLAEHKKLLSGQKQLLCNSAFANKDSVGDTNVLSPKKYATESVGSSSNSSLSGKSQVYRMFAEHKHLLANQRQLPSTSAIAEKDAVNNVSLFGVEDTLNKVKGSIGDSSSNSTLSGKSQVYKLFAVQKHKLAHEKLVDKSANSSKGSVSNSDMPCAEVNCNSLKDSSCNLSLLKEMGIPSSSPSHNSPSLSSRLKKLLESTKIERSECSSKTVLSTSANVFSNPYADREPNSCQQDDNFDSMGGDSIFVKENKSLEEQDSRDRFPIGDENLGHFEKDICTDIQDEDPWKRLRDAFAELGPTKYSTKKVVFVPAGMQY